MLRTDLIEIINKGNTWAFIGAGASVDAGCPTWKGLLDRVIAVLGVDIQSSIYNDKTFQKAFGKNNFPKCFSRVEHYAGRDFLEAAVIAEISKARTPGVIARKITDWPFTGFITTNFDLILEYSLQEKSEHGWLPIGNLGNEIKKVSGDVSQIIWHMHGCVGLTRDKSRLILTEQDYDDIYLEDSPVLNQLRGLLAHRRLVFIGFGFQDWEVGRLLKRVGRLCNPAST